MFVYDLFAAISAIVGVAIYNETIALDYGSYNMYYNQDYEDPESIVSYVVAVYIVGALLAFMALLLVFTESVGLVRTNGA